MSGRKQTVVASILGVLALMFVALGPAMVRAWEQKKLVDRAFAGYSSALVRGEFPEAYGFCAPDFQAATPYDKFVKQQGILRSVFGSLRAVRQGRTEVEGRGSPADWAAVIVADLTYERGTTKFVYEFRLISGRWLLHGYRQE